MGVGVGDGGICLNEGAEAGWSWAHAVSGGSTPALWRMASERDACLHMGTGQSSGSQPFLLHFLLLCTESWVGSCHVYEVAERKPSPGSAGLPPGQTTNSWSPGWLEDTTFCEEVFPIAFPCSLAGVKFFLQESLAK